MQDENPNHRLLQTGNYAGLKFEEGWFFIHILETEYIELKPYILMNETNERDEIAPEMAGSADDEILDQVERQLVAPRRNERNLLFQNFVGVAPSRMQLYPVFGRDRSPNLVGGAEPGNPQVPLNGYDSPYNNPSVQGELFTAEGINDLKLQAYNPMDEAAEARVSFHVNKLKYAVIDDLSRMGGFLRGEIPWRSHAVGLGAQTNDQVRAPSWMLDKFGDAIYTTREILEDTDNGGENQRPRLGEEVMQ